MTMGRRQPIQANEFVEQLADTRALTVCRHDDGSYLAAVATVHGIVEVCSRPDGAWLRFAWHGKIYTRSYAAPFRSQHQGSRCATRFALDAVSGAVGHWRGGGALRPPARPHRRQRKDADGHQPETGRPGEPASQRLR